MKISSMPSGSTSNRKLIRIILFVFGFSLLSFLAGRLQILTTNLILTRHFFYDFDRFLSVRVGSTVTRERLKKKETEKPQRKMLKFIEEFFRVLWVLRDFYLMTHGEGVLRIPAIDLSFENKLS